jgi:hypothetical protein
MNIIINSEFQHTFPELKYLVDKDVSMIEHINGLIYIKKQPTIITGLSKTKNIINCYVHPDIFIILNTYSNEELEISFTHNMKFGNGLISYNNRIGEINLLKNIINIAIKTDNFIYLDYLMNRNINLRDNNLNSILSVCISNILENNKFDILQRLIEYGICISNSNILYEYITTIHDNIIVYEHEDIDNDFVNDNEDEHINYQYNDKKYRIVQNELNLLDKNLHLTNIKYLTDRCASLHYCKQHYDISILEMLTDLQYINDVQWLICRDYLMFVDGTGINIHKDNDEQEYMCRYLTNDFIMGDILSYM